MRVPIKSRRLKAARKWLFNHPAYAISLTVCAFLFILLPQWGAAVWQLFTDKPFFVWLSERMQTLEFSAYWITVPVGTLVLLFIVYLLLSGRRELKAGKPQTGETDTANKESKPNEKMNALIREAVRDLPEVPCGEGWLHAIAENDRLNIQNAVVVSNINFYNYASDTRHPYLEFVFTVFNKSVYEISIDDSIDGYIMLNRKKLKKDNLELEKNNAQNCPVRGTGSFTLYQYLNDADLNRFMNSTEDREFWFNNVIIKIKGGENSPQVVSQQLRMAGQVSKKHSVWHEAHNIRIEELSARIKELEEEKAACDVRLRFEIDVPRSKIYVDGRPYEEFNVQLNLHIRFENSDIYPLIARSVNVLLMKMNEDKTASAISLKEQWLSTIIIENDNPVTLSWENRNLSINGRELTQDHRIDGYLSVSGDYREILNSNCFLRVTMDAMNQPPYNLDFNVRWQDISLGWIGITPRR